MHETYRLRQSMKVHRRAFRLIVIPHTHHLFLSERKLETVPEQDRLEQDYYDYLQAPLQPLQVCERAILSFIREPSRPPLRRFVPPSDRL